MAALIDRATDYATRVCSGEVIAGPYVRAACSRHLKDLERSATTDWPYTFDNEKAADAYDFIENKASLGVGQKFILLPWQNFVVGFIFGWVKKTDGYRRIRTCYVETAKGSGKTPLGAVIGIKMFCNDGEPNAECYVGAATKDQAGIGFKDLVRCVRGSSILSEHVIFRGGEGNEWSARYKSAQGDLRTYRKVAFDTEHSGYRPHYVHLDELHEHPDDSLLAMMRLGFKGRPQPLLMITTNTAHDEFSVCQEYKSRGIRVSKGEEQDDRFFAYIAALDEDDLEGDAYLTNPAVWPKTNPGLPLLPGTEYIETEVKEAEAVPSQMAEVKRLLFCNPTHEVDALISRQLWEQAEVEGLTLDDFKGKECYLGLDLAFRDDFAALAFVFREPFEQIVNNRKQIGFKYSLFIEQWTPSEGIIAKAKRDRAPYQEWAKSGHINAVDGPVIDTSWIAKRLSEVVTDFKVAALAYDQYAFKTLQKDLAEYEVAPPMVAHPQGFSWSAASRERSKGRKPTDPLMELSMPSSTRELVEALKEGRLETPVNHMSRFNVTCSKARIDANGNKVFVRKGYTARVDGLVAASMAVGAAKAKPVKIERGSYLADSALISI